MNARHNSGLTEKPKCNSGHIITLESAFDRSNNCKFCSLHLPDVSLKKDEKNIMIRRCKEIINSWWAK